MTETTQEMEELQKDDLANLHETLEAMKNSESPEMKRFYAKTVEKLRERITQRNKLFADLRGGLEKA